MPVCLIDLCLSVRSRLSVRAISGPGVVFFGADADAREEEGVQQRAAGGAASGRREERGDGPDLRRGSDLAIKAAYCNLYYSLDRHGEEPFRGIDPLARAHLGTSRHISAHLGASLRASRRISAHLNLVAAVCDFEQLLQRGAVRSKAHRRKRVKQQPGGEGGRRLLLLLL